MNFLVTGGAGYIGSHMVKFLQEQNESVVVVDNFSTGNDWAVKNCEIIEVDLLNKVDLQKKLRGRKFDSVFHFASRSIVSESYLKPELYLRDNLLSLQNLLDVMIENNNHNIIFSSSAAIYGNVSFKIKEETRKKPISAYGKSKLLCEKLLNDLSKTSNLKYISLRYFNAAGADKDGKIGEYRTRETHLIPLIFQSLDNKNKRIKIYGNDYNTHDGTCIREYVHVSDLIEAHYKAFLRLEETNCSDSFNLSSENGFSVLDILKSVEILTDKKINYVLAERRKGDPDVLISDCSKAKELLNWDPQNSNIENIISSALNWHKYLNKHIL